MKKITFIFLFVNTMTLVQAQLIEMWDFGIGENQTFCTFQLDVNEDVVFAGKDLIGKLSSDGVLLWTDSLKSQLYSENQIALDESGNVFVASIKSYVFDTVPDDVSPPTIYTIIASKWNPQGEKLWSFEYEPDFPIEFHTKTSLALGSQNLFICTAIVTEGTRKDLHVLKIGFDGNIEQTIDYYNEKDNASTISYEMLIDSDDNIIATGIGAASYFLVKLDANGNLLWTFKHPSIGILRRPHDSMVDQEGNVYVTGDDFSTIKVSAEGELMWWTYYETELPPSTSGDFANRIQVDEGGNVYITGRKYVDFENPPPYSDGGFVTVKFDHLGNELWFDRYDFMEVSYEEGTDIAFYNDELILLGGNSSEYQKNYDCVIRGIDAKTKEEIFQYRFIPDNEQDELLSKIWSDSDGNIYIGGIVGNYPGRALSIRKYGLFTDIETPIMDSYLDVYPNPFEDEICYELAQKPFIEGILTIHSLDGKLMIQTAISEVNDCIDVKTLKSGLYLLNFRSDGILHTQKVFKK